MAEDFFDTGEEDGEPDGGADNHGEDSGADEHKATALVDEGGEGGGGTALAEDTAEDIHTNGGEPKLANGIPAIGGGGGEDEEDKTKGVVGHILASGHEGGAGEEVGIPEGEFPLVPTLADKFFPGVVFEEEVAEEVVVGWGGGGISGGPRGPLGEVIGGDHGTAVKQNGSIKDEG